MKSQITFNDDGDATEIKLKDGTDVIGYAELNDGGAYVRTVYPYAGCEGVTVEQVGEMVGHLQMLPFVEYAKFNYKP